MNWAKVVRWAGSRAICPAASKTAEPGADWRRLLPHRRSVSRAIAFLLGLLLALPASAHLTQVSGDIAGTWHVEPNHSPKAGEPAQVWIALTRRGGQIVPLDQCDCQLAVYQGSAAAGSPILQPALQAIAAENFKGIPGAEVVFPQVGQYQLKLVGRPQAAASFQPFELTYTVTVATGTSAAQPPAPQPEAAVPDSNPPIGATAAANSGGVLTKVLIGLGAIVLVVGAIALTLRQRQARL